MMPAALDKALVLWARDAPSIRSLASVAWSPYGRFTVLLFASGGCINFSRDVSANLPACLCENDERKVLELSVQEAVRRRPSIPNPRLT